MSVQFREGLADHSAKQMIGFLEAKRLYDAHLSFLTGIIHPSLFDTMTRLRGRMAAVKGPVGVVLENGWTSSFPCFGVGVNRATGIHRDTKGLGAGMDIIGVLGSFTEGGRLRLPDLNVVFDWRPGCVGAFDGYDLRHEVEEWGGGHRFTLISFCRKSTWTGLKLEPEITRPTLSEVEGTLKAAEALRTDIVEGIKRKNMEQQEKERQEREGSRKRSKA
jgi:hypothetical protein